MAVLRYDFIGNNTSLKLAAKESVSSLSAVEIAAKNTNVSFEFKSGIAALDSLGRKLLTIKGNSDLFGNSLKNQQSEINAYQGTLNKLLSLGFNPLDADVTRLKTKIDLLTESLIAQKKAAKGGISRDFVSTPSFQEFAPNPSSTNSLSGTDLLIKELNADLSSGKISATQFKSAMDQIAESQSYFSKTTSSAIVATEEQVGAIAALKVAIKDLNVQKATAPAESIGGLNKKIQEAEIELKQLNNIGKVGFDELGNKINVLASNINKPIGQFNRLSYAAKLYEQQSKSSTNPDIISKYNAKLQDAQSQLSKLSNVGKIGFDSTGAAIEKSNSGLLNFGKGLSGAISPLRTLAYIVPGLGLAGIFNLAFEAIGAAASNLELFNTKLTLSESNLANLNEVNKNAAKQYGEQSTNLRILYTAATDVTNSENNRLLAAKELQKEFPSLFGNLKTEAILNGNAAGAYDLASKSILENARAKAAASKIAELAGKILEQEDKKEKVRIGNINANAASASLDKKTGIGAALSASGINENNKKAKAELAESNKLIREYEAQQKRLVEVAGGNNKLALALSAGQNTKTPGGVETSPFESLSKQLDELLSKTQSFAAQSGLSGFPLEVQKITDKYKDLNATLDENIRKTIESKKLTTGERSTLESKQATDRIELQKARLKELDDAFNTSVFKALDKVKEKADKTEKIERDLQEKILAINEQAVANIGSKQETETDKIILEWEKRKQAAQGYFDELIKLNNVADKNDPLGFDNAIKSLKIQGAQAATNGLIASGSNSQVTNKLLEPFSRGIDLGLRKFSTDFYSTLTEVETYTKGTFSSIFTDLTSKLTTSLNQVFLNTVTQGLSNALQKAISSVGNGLVNSSGGLTTLGKVAGAAAIGGGIVSASTPKTSTIGQGLGGALSGAGTGAAIGSIVPVIGTVTGAVIGGVVGLLGGIFGSSSARKKEEEQRQQQLEEAKKQTELLRQQNLAYTSQIIGRMTANGVITGIDVGAQGQLVAKVSGSDLQFVLDRTKKAR